ncbi:MAG: DUF2203 domain-containing protein [Myxococcota bacterium]
MESKRYFTPSEANRLIPRLEEIFGRALQLHSQLRSTQEQLIALGHPATPALLENDATLDGPDQVRQLKARFRGLYEAIGAEVGDVESLGGHVKDIEIGLVDFFSLLAGGGEVLLCWRMGEKSIGFWHDPQSGFGGRQPIDGQQFTEAGRRVH